MKPNDLPIPSPVPVINAQLYTYYNKLNTFSRSFIRSSTSSIPTCNRIKESTTPVFSLSSLSIVKMSH